MREAGRCVNGQWIGASPLENKRSFEQAFESPLGQRIPMCLRKQKANTSESCRAGPSLGKLKENGEVPWEGWATYISTSYQRLSVSVQYVQYAINDGNDVATGHLKALSPILPMPLVGPAPREL